MNSEFELLTRLRDAISQDDYKLFLKAWNDMLPFISRNNNQDRTVEKTRFNAAMTEYVNHDCQNLEILWFLHRTARTLYKGSTHESLERLFEKTTHDSVVHWLTEHVKYDRAFLLKARALRDEIAESTRVLLEAETPSSQ